MEWAMKNRKKKQAIVAKNEKSAVDRKCRQLEYFVLDTVEKRIIAKRTIETTETDTEVSASLQYFRDVKKDTEKKDKEQQRKPNLYAFYFKNVSTDRLIGGSFFKLTTEKTDEQIYQALREGMEGAFLTPRAKKEMLDIIEQLLADNPNKSLLWAVQQVNPLFDFWYDDDRQDIELGRVLAALAQRRKRAKVREKSEPKKVQKTVRTTNQRDKGTSVKKT